jgi:hypothetical protein
MKSAKGAGQWGLEMVMLELALQRMSRCHAHIDGDILIASSEKGLPYSLLSSLIASTA